MKYSKAAEIAIKQSLVFASKIQSELLTPEHLLYVLTDDSDVNEILETLSFDIPKLKNELETYLLENVQSLRPNTYPQRIASYEAVAKTWPTTYVEKSGRNTVETTDMLLSIYWLQDSMAKYLLSQYATMEELVQEVAEQKQKRIFGGEGDANNADSSNSGSKKEVEYLIDLNEKARNSKIDPVIGREDEIDRAMHILIKRKKNNVILVGEAGVGKTSIAEGLAKKIVEGDVHDALKNHVIFSLDLGALTAGTKFRGEFEERLKKTIKKVKSTPNAVLFIDEIHTIIGAGSAGGSQDAANLLKPALSSGEISCMGATTYKEYRNHFEKDAALSRRFEKIDIEEPSQEDTIKILVGLKDYYEKHHGVKYTDDALRAAVELSSKYITNRFLPDKAIDIMDEAGVTVKLNSQIKEKIVSLEVVEKVISKVARIPEKTIIGSEREKVKNLKADLGRVVFGQEEAIDKLVSSIQLAKSGLRRPNKPVGSFLFCGPTGVGKTEVAKQIAASMGYNFVRFDMSEYMQKHEVAKLIGAPPGYVGFDQEGALTGAVIKNPSSVILLDELEKAHPDIQNILLQVMDNGSLTDNYGKKADFRQSIIIMTSNAGTSEVNQKVISFTDPVQNAKPTQEIERTFAPEFRNRLDALVWFNRLGEKTIKEVLDKNLMHLDMMLVDKKVVITYTDALKNWLAKKGYDPLMGARPMARLVEEKIALPLSSEILFGKLTEGGSVEASLEEDKVKFVFTESKNKKEVTKKRTKTPAVEPKE
jgi:ATP-dependent Clp protease ATP-binding subunit ClpA